MTKWGPDNAILTFAPAAGVDSEAKTIHKGVAEYLDVIFVLPIDAMGQLVLLPGTKNHLWNGHPQFNQIFNEVGEYILTIQLVAHGMDPLTIQAVFDHKQNRFLSTLRLVVQP